MAIANEVAEENLFTPVDGLGQKQFSKKYEMAEQDVKRSSIENHESMLDKKQFHSLKQDLRTNEKNLNLNKLRLN